MFHPLVETWLARRFGAPTPAQAAAWPAIATGADALIAAPTGSGKTLAAFLACLDRLVRAALEGALEDRTHVVYVSPLKALSNDVQKNLDQPIAEIRALAIELGYPDPQIRTAVRTGDTTAKERRFTAKTPPHVLVTTPESLFILLTSVSGRRALEGASTIILDEIHAVARDKRGAHLALSVERLHDLVVRAGHPRPQRIGLSATIRPIEVAARLVVGGGEAPAIVDTGSRRDVDLAIEIPRDELGAACTHEQWDEVYDKLAKLVAAHRSTLVFVNTRRLVERMAHQLGERVGQEHVAAHHGSLSRARRQQTEARLKAGDLRVVVATSSLELGIDVGAIDLCAIIGSPRSIGAALQRIGRSGHTLQATPKGRFFPLTRDQLVECGAIVRAARRGLLDAVELRQRPLDILAQQIVAIVSAEDRGEDELFDLVKRATHYADLRRDEFDDVVAMLSEGVSTRRGRAGALVHRDGVNRRLRGRRGARLAALTSGGAIPDNGNYDVLLQPDATKIGTVDEDFAIDSSGGDIFLLGNHPWQIARVEPGRVWVEDAAGRAPTVPFWFGEAPARTPELSREVGALREEVAQRLFVEGGDAEASLQPDRVDATIAWIESECALERAGARLLCEYIAAGRAALGAVPTVDTVIAERFFDEAGGMQLVLHAPFGGRVNRALGLTLRKRFCRSFDFELQAAATDDGVILSLGPQHSFPLESVLDLLHVGLDVRMRDADARMATPGSLREVLEQAAIQGPMFGTRFRWNATRSLALLRFRGGRRVPPALLRMRSDDLMASVFPAQVGCQDNHGVGAVQPVDHPLVNETLRDCLEEVMDAEGLAVVLGKLRGGQIRFVTRETPEPSVFSHEILNANPYAFLDDAPLEERRARAVAVRRGLPSEIAEREGAFDAALIAEIVREAQPDVRNADELHDLLLEQGAFPEADGRAAGWGAHFDALAKELRAARLVPIDDARVGNARLWVAAERRPLAEAIWRGARFEPDVRAPVELRPRGGAEPGGPIDPGAALAEIVRARLALVGPTSSEALGHALGVDGRDVDIALAQVENEGIVLRGRFSHGLPPTGRGAIEWCHRALLARIHRRTVDGLRRAVEPVSAADLMRFLFAWQGLCGARPRGRDGVSRVIEQLQGCEIAAGAWEAEILPARIAGYEPAWLDELCLSGEVVWGRLAPRASGSTPTRAAPITLARRRELGWLRDGYAAVEGAAEPHDEERRGLSPPALDVLAILQRDGASFFDDIVAATSHARVEVEDALWELVGAGRITGDGFAGLRALIARRDERWSVGRMRGPVPPVASGRWALLRAADRRGLGGVAPIVNAGSLLDDATLESFARLYLRRYGVVFRDLLAREPAAPPWRELVRVYRRLEMRGDLRGGHLVHSFVGEQFALPEALDALRAIRREAKTGEVVTVSACDPLNLVGVVTPGPRVAAHLGARVVFRDGTPVVDPIEPAAPSISLA